jgi:hypothetical protein
MKSRGIEQYAAALDIAGTAVAEEKRTAEPVGRTRPVVATVGAYRKSVKNTAFAPKEAFVLVPTHTENSVRPNPTAEPSFGTETPKTATAPATLILLVKSLLDAVFPLCWSVQGKVAAKLTPPASRSRKPPNVFVPAMLGLVHVDPL